jgi:hypothetical protein
MEVFSTEKGIRLGFVNFGISGGGGVNIINNYSVILLLSSSLSLLLSVLFKIHLIVLVYLCFCIVHCDKLCNVSQIM